jgi:hypothetical protein
MRHIQYSGGGGGHNLLLIAWGKNGAAWINRPIVGAIYVLYST